MRQLDASDGPEIEMLSDATLQQAKHVFDPLQLAIRHLYPTYYRRKLPVFPKYPFAGLLAMAYPLLTDCYGRAELTRSQAHLTPTTQFRHRNVILR